MHPGDLVPQTDLSPAAWLSEQSTGYVTTVGDFLHPAYDAYVRVPRSLGAYSDPEQRPTLLPLRDVLAHYTSTPQRCWFTFWDGFRLPRAWRSAPRLGLPARPQLLFAAGLANLEVVNEAFGRVGYPDPTLWWPHDRSWVAHWDVDSDAVYVACTQAAAAELIAAGLDAELVSMEDEVTIEY